MARKRKASPFAMCVGRKMRGKHFKTKSARNAAFGKAAKSCARK